MKKTLKIAAIAILLIILSPLISVAIIVAVALQLGSKRNLERFEDRLHRLTNQSVLN
ncbi:MAG: hypothetical protein J6X18_00610 [Bacteroidales bacterium]|nr:hypothetical protein [Bacteroidales bacterium]